MQKKLVSALFVSLLLIACDGIGRPLVDQNSRFGGAAECGTEILSCESVLGTEAPLVPFPTAPFSLESCGGLEGPCSPLSPLRGCTTTVPISNGDTRAVPTELDCMRVTVLAEAPAQNYRLENLVLRQTELTLVSEQPLTVEIARSQITQSRIQLRGPITLRIVEQSSLRDVHVSRDPLAPAPTTSASLEVFESDTRELIAEHLGGHIELVRSRVVSTQLYAPKVALESLQVGGLAISAETLHAVQIQGAGVRLQIGRGTLSEWKLQRLQIEQCNDVLLAGSVVYESTFAPCLGKLRVDDCHIDTSLVAGTVEGNQTTWAGNALGVGSSPSSFELWSDTLLSNRLCPGIVRMTLDLAETVVCNICDQLIGPPEVRLCPASEPNEFDRVIKNDNPSCPALDMVKTFPVCAPPVRNENPR